MTGANGSNQPPAAAPTAADARAILAELRALHDACDQAGVARDLEALIAHHRKDAQLSAAGVRLAETILLRARLAKIRTLCEEHTRPSMLELWAAIDGPL